MLLNFINALAFIGLFIGFVCIVGWPSYIIIDTLYDWITTKLKGDDNHG